MPADDHACRRQTGQCFEPGALRRGIGRLCDRVRSNRSPQQTGSAAQSTASTVTAFSIDFNYRSNALATKPPPQARRLLNPLYTGVTSGFAGLYQVNFVVPPTPPSDLPTCVDPATIVAFGNVVVSNLTVSLGSNFSFDGAGICVLPAS